MKNVLQKSVILSLCLLAACAGSLKKEELQKVHKVAVIGLELQQQKSVSGMDLLSLAARTAKPVGATIQLRKDSAHVEGVYNDLVAKLRKERNWKVLSMAEVRDNPAYKEYFKSKTEGFQNRPATNDRFVTFGAPGILDFFPVMTTEAEQLKKLAQALRVDAIAFATVEVNLGSNGMFAALTGGGEFKPQGKVNMLIKNAVTGDVLMNSVAEGPQVDKGEKNVAGVANEEKINVLAAEAAGLSFKKLFDDVKLN